jgi:hypothetical protein
MVDFAGRGVAPTRRPNSSYCFVAVQLPLYEAFPVDVDPLNVCLPLIELPSALSVPSNVHDVEMLDDGT